jgi:hypothetical protein
MTRERVVKTLIFFGESLAEKEQADVLREVKETNHWAFAALAIAMYRATHDLQRAIPRQPGKSQEMAVREKGVMTFQLLNSGEERSRGESPEPLRRPMMRLPEKTKGPPSNRQAPDPNNQTATSLTDQERSR